jgi:hypothetical protein
MADKDSAHDLLTEPSGPARNKKRVFIAAILGVIAGGAACATATYLLMSVQQSHSSAPAPVAAKPTDSPQADKPASQAFAQYVSGGGTTYGKSTEIRLFHSEVVHC